MATTSLGTNFSAPLLSYGTIALYTIVDQNMTLSDKESVFQIYRELLKLNN